MGSTAATVRAARKSGCDTGQRPARTASTVVMRNATAVAWLGVEASREVKSAHCSPMTRDSRVTSGENPVSRLHWRLSPAPLFYALGAGSARRFFGLAHPQALLIMPWLLLVTLLSLERRRPTRGRRSNAPEGSPSSGLFFGDPLLAALSSALFFTVLRTSVAL